MRIAWSRRNTLVFLLSLAGWIPKNPLVGLKNVFSRFFGSKVHGLDPLVGLCRRSQSVSAVARGMGVKITPGAGVITGALDPFMEVKVRSYGCWSLHFDEDDDLMNTGYGRAARHIAFPFCAIFVILWSRIVVDL